MPNKILLNRFYLDIYFRFAVTRHSIIDNALHYFKYLNV